ncbi:MAG: hypothetical protein IT563_09810 [Alphaproteobacteria bacterium]|nr:hypothetical protein [Alphaproteobacteria bacterium]
MVRAVYRYCAGEQDDKNSKILSLSKSAGEEKIFEQKCEGNADDRGANQSGDGARPRAHCDSSPGDPTILNNISGDGGLGECG